MIFLNKVIIYYIDRLLFKTAFNKLIIIIINLLVIYYIDQLIFKTTFNLISNTFLSCATVTSPTINSSFEICQVYSWRAVVCSLE